MVRYFTLLVFIVFLTAFSLRGQEVLLFEDFNSCAFPAGWEAHFTGNQNPVWYVGTSTNNNSQGESIDGTCALIIDDDATGDNTPPFVADFITPAFNASQYSTILLEADIHYRDWNQANEFFEVWVTDGVNEKRIARYDETRTNGDTMADFFKLRYDLSFITNAPQARVIFRYDDQAGFGWWAVVDNVKITGIGAGVNIIAETFDGCEKPAGWETEILTGNHDWQFGVITQGAALNGENAMDGSCFVYFDDDILLDSAEYSAVRLYSPWFDGTAFAQFETAFDVIMRYYSERIAVYVRHGNGEEFLVREAAADIGGPYFHQYVHAVLDLSPFRAQQMQLIFEYDDGQDWGWWAGFDNIKVTGSGEAHDICSKAVTLQTGANCLAANNFTALFDGPPVTCTERASAGLWYKWQSDFTGNARLATHAQFNDVVNIFQGDCNELQLLHCTNRNEHGFEGEVLYFPATAGQTYLIRISGQEAGFGIPRGSLCVEIDPSTVVPPAPANDDCATAQLLNIGANCLPGDNYFAATSANIPSLNERARADTWYSFTAPALAANEVLSIVSNADFSDIITLWKGSCAALTEVSGNHFGNELLVDDLVAGQTYFIQIAGNFASIEGHLCPQIAKKTVNAPSNENCLQAQPLSLGNNCTTGNNAFAGFSGICPPCVPSLTHDLWYSFVAPVSGSVRFSTGADFQHIAAVWKGNCGSLEPVWCAKNPLRCDGFTTIGALEPGQTYFLQIGAEIGLSGQNTGQFCIKIIDGNFPADFEPMSLNVLEICNGQGAATIDVHHSGGTAPFTYLGTNDGDLVPGGQPYIVVISDANGCEVSYASIAKDCEGVLCNIAAALAPVAPTCNDAADGTMEAIVLGGTAPFVYAWSSGQTTALATGLQAAIYTVTVVDANACADIISDTLLAPDALTAVPVALVQPSTGQSNGSILVDISGGNGNYIYLWLLNNAPFSTQKDLVNAPAGNYTLQITDSKGCTGSFPFTLEDLVGTASPEIDFFAEISPNPALEKANLFISLPGSQWLHLSVVSPEGKLVITQTLEQVSERSMALPIKNLAPGVYAVRLFTAQQSKTLTLVKL